MLSAFTFREFRGINRRAGGICMYARVFVPARLHPQLQRAFRRGEEAETAPEYSASARFMHPSCAAAKRNTSQHESHRCFLAAAVLIANSTGDRCVPVRHEAFNSAPLVRPLSALVLTSRASISRFRVPSVALKLQDNYRVASLSAIVVYSLQLGIFTR